MKTIYVSTKYAEYLDKHCLGSAGPNASVSGMKKLIWGKNACVVRCGKYIYWVPQDVYYSLKCSKEV